VPALPVLRVVRNPSSVRRVRGFARRFSVLLVLGFAGVIVSPAGAGEAAGLIAGEGKFSTTSAGASSQFTITAHGMPGDAQGTVRVNAPSFAWRGDVECLFVLENRAAASGTLDEPVRQGNLVFPYFLAYVEDNGEPSDAVPDRALVVATTFSVAGSPDCGLSLGSLGPAPLAQGNVVVKDVH